jgi:antitoxin component YwqK of YwqJK toxin-antitoxin module
MLSETPWLNGKIDGVQKEYYPTGAKKSETVYRQGKREGECRVYFPTGQTQIEGKYVNNAYEGNWIFYNERGSVKLKMEYKKGVLQNPGEYDRIQLQEFQMLEQMRGKIKDPA